MPFSLIRKEIGGLAPLTSVLNGKIIDAPPPQRALVPVKVKVVEGRFAAGNILRPFDPSYKCFAFDEKPVSPSSRGEYGFYPGVPEGLDEQLTYDPRFPSIIIGGICSALGDLFRVFS